MTAKTKQVLLPSNFLVPTAWANTLADFLTDRQLQGARPATITYYKTEILLFIRWAEPIGAVGLSDLTPDLLRAYFLALAERRNKTGVHTAWRCLKTWLMWAWGEFDMPGICPMKKVKVASPSKEPKAGIPMQDIGLMLDTCNGDKCGVNGLRDRAIILFLLDTGIRRRELCALTLGDVQGDVVKLQPDNTKTGKARHAFMERATLKAIKSYLMTRDNLTADAPLFATDDGQPLTVSGLRAIIRRRCMAAGVPPVGLHAFRRTFAIETLRGSGGDLVSTSRLLGHTDIETTKQYLKQEVDDLSQVHKRSSPVSKLLKERRK